MNKSRFFSLLGYISLQIVPCALYCAPVAEAVPWTKNFLEIRPSLSIERLSVTPRHRHLPGHSPRHCYQGTLVASASPCPDWEADLTISGRSFETGRIGARVERQVLSDLTDGPVALTLVASGSMSRMDRVRKPVFFEMAASTAEFGVGIGRHLLVRQSAYTQLFAYCVGGIGTRQAKWATGEIGIQQVFFSRHFARFAVGCTHTYGHHHSFQGFGSIRSVVRILTSSYAYRFSNGIEGRLSYILRTLNRGCISGSHTCQVSLSIPLSL